MSKQSVKMVYVLDDVEKTVGRCHPGQARLLQKAGAAEFRGGKLYLKNAPRNSNLVASEADEGWEPESHSYRKRWSAPEDPYEIEAIPKELWGGEGRKSAQYTRIDCSTFKQWLGEVLSRRDAGHELVPYDDPRTQKLGFLDYTDTSEVYVGLFSLKQERDEMDPAVREALRSPDGRHKLINPDWMPYTAPTTDLPDDLFDVPDMEEVKHVNAVVGLDADGVLQAKGITNPRFLAKLRASATAGGPPEGWTRARVSQEPSVPLYYDDGNRFYFGHDNLYRRKGKRLAVVRLGYGTHYEMFRAFLDEDTLKYQIRDVFTLEGANSRQRAIELGEAFLEGDDGPEGESLTSTSLDDYTGQMASEILHNLAALDEALARSRKIQVAEGSEE